MKKKKYWLFLLLFCQLIMHSCTLMAQTQSMYVIRGSEAHSMHYFKQAKAPADMWLNPYFDTNWSEGFMLFSDSIYWSGDLRLDLYRKQMEMRIEGDTFFISQPFIVNLMKMGDTYFIYAPFIEQKRDKRTFGADYFEVLNEPGQVNLLLRRGLRVDESSNSKSSLLFGLPLDEKKMFTQTKKYYLQIDKEGPAIPFRRSRQSLMKQLPDHHKEIKSFAKRNKLSFSDPSDVAKIINHFNAIHSQK
jgi:hypothetical protein